MSESSRKILSDNNVSITNPRILVLEALMESQNPQTIDDLQNRLGNKVAKSTLYRVLGDLKKINVLHEFTSPDNTTVVEQLLSAEIKKIERKFNFQINDHRVEMFGTCTDQCSNCK